MNICKLGVGVGNYCGDIRRPFVGRDALGTPLTAYRIFLLNTSNCTMFSTPQMNCLANGAPGRRALHNHKNLLHPLGDLGGALNLCGLTANEGL